MEDIRVKNNGGLPVNTYPSGSMGITKVHQSTASFLIRETYLIHTAIVEGVLTGSKSIFADRLARWIEAYKNIKNEYCDFGITIDDIGFIQDEISDEIMNDCCNGTDINKLDKFRRRLSKLYFTILKPGGTEKPEEVPHLEEMIEKRLKDHPDEVIFWGKKNEKVNEFHKNREKMQVNYSLISAKNKTVKSFRQGLAYEILNNHNNCTMDEASKFSYAFAEEMVRPRLPELIITGREIDVWLAYMRRYISYGKNYCRTAKTRISNKLRQCLYCAIPCTHCVNARYFPKMEAERKKTTGGVL